MVTAAGTAADVEGVGVAGVGPGRGASNVEGSLQSAAGAADEPLSEGSMKAGLRRSMDTVSLLPFLSMTTVFSVLRTTRNGPWYAG